MKWLTKKLQTRSTQRAQTSAERQHNRIVAVLPGSGRNGLPDPDSDTDRHENVISWSLGHTPALHKISSKSVDNSIIQWIRISDFGLLDLDGDPDRLHI